ncbi:hypothetical protein VTG60DRAFT_4379 [Thermothelomyces hinnuleus]
MSARDRTPSPSGPTVLEAILENNIIIKYREDLQTEPKKPLTYAVGDSKLKQKWKSSWLGLKPENGKILAKMDPRLSSDKNWTTDVSKRRMEPLHQVATYCRYAQTRYAFIITQAELVALRIRRVPKASRDTKTQDAAVEYASIPWDAKTGLTVNLAIWALGCMGMNDGHREMETSDGKNQPLDKMARLTWWIHDGKAKVYENVISKRQIPEHEWKEEYRTFVQLTERDGNSYTSDLLRDADAVPPMPSDAVATHKDGHRKRRSDPDRTNPESSYLVGALAEGSRLLTPHAYHCAAIIRTSIGSWIAPGNSLAGAISIFFARRRPESLQNLERYGLLGAFPTVQTTIGALSARCGGNRLLQAGCQCWRRL